MTYPQLLINIAHLKRGQYTIELLRHTQAGRYTRALLARCKRAARADVLAHKFASQYQCDISEG